jgi:hypothetical protein
VLPTLLLGSWALPASSPAPSFSAVIPETQSIVGGEWQVQDDPNSRGCILPNGTAGRTTSVLRIGEPSSAIDAVAVYWEAQGYTVQRLDIGPVTQLLATTGAGQQLIVRASDRATTLQGESECRPAE